MRIDESLFPPIRIFYSYAQKDAPLLNELEKHLSALKRQGHIIGWHNRNISAGREWLHEISAHINTADIILLLISVDFLASDYCYGVEMQQALARHEAKDVRVIPIIVRSVDVEGTPFSGLRALPSNGLPINNWPVQDDAFVDIVRDIRKVVNELRDSGISHGILTNPFLFNLPLPDPKEFYGRKSERITLWTNTKGTSSTSLVGRRRSGKTWLMHYVYLSASQELGSKYLIGYLDATAPHCSTVIGFVTTALKALGLQDYPFSTEQDGLKRLSTKQDGLKHLYEIIKKVTEKKQVPILCIDEFEGFGKHPDEFDLDFFYALRSMTQIGFCLLTASQTPLIEIVGAGNTSGFFNVFQQITLKPFDQKDAEYFVREKGKSVGLTLQECEKLLIYGQYEGKYWPFSLQLAGKTLVEDKALAQREQDPDYYRPAEQAYWDEFERRLQEVYKGMMR